MRNLLVASILESTRYDNEGNDMPRNRIRLVCRATEDSTGKLFSWYTEAGEDCEVSARTLQGAQQAAWQAWEFGDPESWQLRATWIHT